MLRYNKYINENVSKFDVLLVVDIQPAYEKYISFDMSDFINYLNSEEKDVLYLYNGYELGYSDDEYNIKEWLIDNGLNSDINIIFYEKTYGFFRNAIDSGIYDDTIINTAKYMLKVGYDDSRDFDCDELCDDTYIYIPELKDFIYDNISKNDYIELVGGGEHECLKEVSLLLDIMNIDYYINYDFVY